MNIMPGIGTDTVQFGITEADAIKLFGKPDKVYPTDAECNRLQFNRLLLELSFEEHQGGSRLGWIEFHHPETSLGGRKLIGAAQQDTLDFVTEFLGEPPEIEDNGSFVSVSYWEHWLELQFRFDKLSNINIGVLHDDDDNAIWPS